MVIEEGQKQNKPTVTESAERPTTFPIYNVIYTGEDRLRYKPLVRGMNALMSGLSTVARYSYSQMNTETPAVDVSSSSDIQGLLTAINHLGTLMQKRIGGDVSEHALKDALQYVNDIPREHMFNNQLQRFAQTRRVLESVTNSVRTKLHNQDLSTSLNVMSHHIMTLQQQITSQLPQGDLPNGKSPLQVKFEHVEVKSREELEIRGEMFGIIIHDVLNGVAGLKGNQQLYERTTRRLAEPTTDQSTRAMLEERASGQFERIKPLWPKLFETTKRMALLMNEPYRKNEMGVGAIRKYFEEVVRQQISQHPELQIRVDSSTSDMAVVIWSEEWAKSLLSNAAQNVTRVWRDVQADDELKSMRGDHPELHVSVSGGLDRRPIVIQFKDNGTGFSTKRLADGFNGQGEYRSHNESTGTAMKAMRKMAEAYDGELRIFNRYGNPKTGEVTQETSDPNFIPGDNEVILGATVQLVLPRIS